MASLVSRYSYRHSDTLIDSSLPRSFSIYSYYLRVVYVCTSQKRIWLVLMRTEYVTLFLSAVRKQDQNHPCLVFKDTSIICLRHDSWTTLIKCAFIRKVHWSIFCCELVTFCLCNIYHRQEYNSTYFGAVTRISDCVSGLQRWRRSAVMFSLKAFHKWSNLKADV